MKRIFVLLFFSVFILLFAASCKKDNNGLTKINTIKLSIQADSIEVDKSAKIDLLISPFNASDTTVTWTSSDTTTLKVVDGLIIGLAVGKATITATANDGSGVNGTLSIKVIRILNKEKISAKWNVIGLSDYKSLEFNESGNYIIVKNASTKSTANQVILFNTYKIIDNSTILLSGLGYLNVSTIDKNRFNFSITLKDSPNNVIDISATKEVISTASIKTDLLCKTWEIVSFGGSTDEGGIKILFSKAGTYLLSLGNEAIIGHWNWCNKEEDKLAFTIENTLNCEGIEIIKNISLTPNSFSGIDMENGQPDELILAPVTYYLKSSETIKTGTNRNRKKTLGY